MPEITPDIDVQRYPQYFTLSDSGECIAYRASPAAIALFGHQRIIAAIQILAVLEPGGRTPFAITAGEMHERLLLMHNPVNGEVLAIAESECRGNFPETTH